MNKPDSKTLPQTAGVYIYRDAGERVIYVGKAKNLRSRVLSYFRADASLSPKTKAMVAHAHTLETMSTATEQEALLLEATLIKKYRPRYNIILRDDKEYILFRLRTADLYPRLEVVRRARPGQEPTSTLLFGPYSSAGAARETWRAIHGAFPLRRCSDKSFRNRVRPCLYHHMGQCLGPCVLPVEPAQYAALVRQVALLLEGRSDELLAALRQEMLSASDMLDFERAATLRDRANAVEKTLERQDVVFDRAQDMDVLGISSVDNGLALGILFVRQGVLLDKRTFFWPGLTLDDAPELVRSVLVQFYRQGLPVPPRIVTPWLSKDALRLAQLTTDDWEEEQQTEDSDDVTLLCALLTDLRRAPVRLTRPRTERENRLVSMAAMNAREAVRQKESPLPQRLAVALGAPRPVDRIEAVDVSHTGGTATRVGMVVFDGGRPLRGAYRTYAVDAGGDDYAALSQWAARRINAGPPWPDLLLIDGGRGQIAAVHRVFDKAGLAGAMCMAGIAKARDDEGRPDRRAGNDADRIFVPLRSNPLPIAAASPELFFLQHVRDTVHDFALGRHRKARSGQAFAGELLRIPGVGPKTARLLWRHFGSLEAMAEAGLEALQQIPGIGAEKAKLLHERLQALVSKA